MPTEVIGDNTGDDYAGTEDNTIWTGEPLWNNATRANMGQNTYGGVTDEGAKILIKFSGLSSLPSSAVVSSSSFNLYQNGKNGGASTFTIELRRLLRDWIEGTLDNADRSGDTPYSSCWDEYGDENAWATAGALSDGNDRVATVTASLSVGNSLQYYSFIDSQLDADIEDFIDGTYSNYGWKLDDNGAVNKWKNFTQSESTDGERPYLSVTYTSGGALLDAAVSGAGTVVATLTTAITMAASVAASGIVAAVLTTSILLGGAVTGSASAAAALTTTEIPLDGSLSTVAMAASELTIQSDLFSAAVTVSATATAELTVDSVDLFNAAVTASAGATGELATQIPFSAAAAGSVTTVAALTTQIQFSSALTATSSQASGLTTSITVDCAVSGSCTVASELTAPKQALLAASSTGTASASAILTTGAPIENVVSYTPYFAKTGAAEALFTKTFSSASYFTPKRTKEVWF